MSYKVSIPLYLRLVKPLSGVTRFQLQNQTLRDGNVVFTGNGGRKRLQAIIDYHNTGKTPPGELLNPYIMPVGKFTLEMLQQKVESIRGPDSDGYYHGRCPSCKEQRGGDTGHDHLYANPSTGRIGCFYGCKKKNIERYLTATTEQVLDALESSNFPTDWKAACGFIRPSLDSTTFPSKKFYLVEGSQGWDTVGGKREGNESPMSCFIREAKEEIGVELEDIKYLGYEPNSKSILFTATAKNRGRMQEGDSVTNMAIFTIPEARKTKVSFRGRQHLKMLERKPTPLPKSVQNAEVVSPKSFSPELSLEKLQTAAVVLEQNEDFLKVQKLTKTGEPGATYMVQVSELSKFANSFTSFKKGQRITIKEHYDVLGWDLVKDQGNRSITRKYHPYIAALYALNEIVVYKDGSFERRI